jgi:hypothetical protein
LNFCQIFFLSVNKPKAGGRTTGTFDSQLRGENWQIIAGRATVSVSRRAVH